jgi:hypothetical protein
MIGGTIHFAQQSTPAAPMHRERARMSPHTEKLLELVKFYGRIEFEMAKLMNVTWRVARNSVVNATFVEGSRIYEDFIDGQTVSGGWNEIPITLQWYRRGERGCV